MKRKCSQCGRKQGSTKNLIGEEEGTHLGPVEKCDICGRWACPDCMAEADCCFADMPEDADEATWAPPGWRLVLTKGHMREYERASP